MDDGSFTVEAENEATEGMEQGSEPQEGTQADMTEDSANGEAEQAYQSIDEALSAAAEMLSGSEEQNDQPMMDGEEEFSRGFKSIRGTTEEQQAFRR